MSYDFIKATEKSGITYAVTYSVPRGYATARVSTQEVFDGGHLDSLGNMVKPWVALWDRDNEHMFAVNIEDIVAMSKIEHP